MTVTPFNLGPQVTAWIISEGLQSSPQQADREVYENGSESPGTSQFMFFGFNADNGFLCKAGADDGDSMDRTNHLVYMQTIMNTGVGKTTAKIGASANKGVGARIATLAHNPDGMDVYARTPAEQKAGIPWHLVRLMPQGVFVFDIVDAFGVITQDTIVDLDDADPEIAQFPDFVKKAGHGVVVVFRGDGVADNWTEDEWKRTYAYLQSRYYSFPLRVWVDGEKIPALAGRVRTDYRYEIPSLSDYYAKHTGHTGIVTLSDGAQVEWFVFDRTARGVLFDSLRRSGVDKGKPVGVSMETGPARSAGFRGVCLRERNELFDHSDRRMASFNVIGQRATQRVALIITPPPGLLMETTNRQHLVRIGGGDIPWLEWGKEFAENMPDPIKALMDEDFKASDTISVEDLDRLDPDWYKRIKQRNTHIVNPDGTLWVEPDQDVAMREGSSGGVRNGDNPNPNPTPGPNPGPQPGDQDGGNIGNDHSGSRRTAKPAKPRTRTSVKGSKEDMVYLDLQAIWLPDVPATPGAPTWDGTVSDPEVAAKGWAWYPALTSNKIYMRRTGDPFAKTLAKYLAKHPTTPRTKIQGDVESAYSIEVISKIVYLRECDTMGWTSSDQNDMVTGSSLSFSLVGLNSVEALVENLLRRTTTAPKPGKKYLRKPKP